MEAHPFDLVKGLFEELKEELERMSATENKELDRIHDNFFGLFKYGMLRIENLNTYYSTEQRIRYPQTVSLLGPTQLANLSEVQREYGLNHYGLDIEFFWMRLLKVIKVDTELYPILEEAKSQLYFTVATTCILGITTLIWVFPSFYFTTQLLPYVLTMGVGFPATVVFYKITIQY